MRMIALISLFLTAFLVDSARAEIKVQCHSNKKSGESSDAVRSRTNGGMDTIRATTDESLPVAIIDRGGSDRIRATTEDGTDNITARVQSLAERRAKWKARREKIRDAVAAYMNQNADAIKKIQDLAAEHQSAFEPIATRLPASFEPVSSTPKSTYDSISTGGAAAAR